MKIKVLALMGSMLFTCLFLFSACEDEEGPSNTNVDCNTVTGATFTSNGGKIKSILENKCGSGKCHGSGGDGARDWTYSSTYAGNQSRFSSIASEVKSGRMPEPGATKLTQEEFNQIICWSQNGFKE
jgi:hypothetical protein